MTNEGMPRAEYPRPQFTRSEWLNLNGKWGMEFDFGKSGLEKKIYQREINEQQIVVPFCVESKLSGVAYTDFVNALWYQREINIPESWQDKLVILHFGGVDSECKVFVDDVFVGEHFGGQSSFELDITKAVKFGTAQKLTIYVVDEIRQALYGHGKQSLTYESLGCNYTRVTGIWQTVWVEAVNKCGLAKCQIIANYDDVSFDFVPHFYNYSLDHTLKIKVLEAGKVVGSTTSSMNCNSTIRVALASKHEWNPDDPFLYDIELEVVDSQNKIVDKVNSYAGLRKISWVGNKLYLNNQEIFLRFVLDQGFYIDGIWTAPSDEDLKNDILLSKSAGFNGARLHQKVFEERFHYWADRLGYLTWAEYGNWGMNLRSQEAKSNVLREWQHILLRDINHPSIIGWSPLNETVHPTPECLKAVFVTDKDLEEYRTFVTQIYDLSKSLDPSRPINDSSGYLHVKTDLWTVHLYRKDLEDLKAALFPENEPVFRHAPQYEVEYNNQPYINDEFGGFKYVNNGDDSGWGYHGLRLESADEVCRLIEEQADFMIYDERMAGYCYTQLTDVEQEKNGIYNYDRSSKFSVEALQKAFGKKPKRSKW